MRIFNFNVNNKKLQSIMSLFFLSCDWIQSLAKVKMLQVDINFKFIVMIMKECCIQFYPVEENAKDLI